MPPTITAATPADLPAVFELLERSGLPRAGLAAHVAGALVAREGARIVGTAAVELYGKAALLRSVAVTAERRREGLGQALTTAVLELARQRGARTVYLLTEAAAGFFTRWGFRAIARTEVDDGVLGSAEFTGACPASAVIMVRAL
ncbi:MAG TPA: arsenic resistance N-acetyltransferase ArsN2 [Gemmatimonadales bacterium]|nr:arsenic resistance N-acetyltransferase ArsN2 [Gemmatimonadales bacterium]